MFGCNDHPMLRQTSWLSETTLINKVERIKQKHETQIKVGNVVYPFRMIVALLTNVIEWHQSSSLSCSRKYFHPEFENSPRFSEARVTQINGRRKLWQWRKTATSRVCVWRILSTQLLFSLTYSRPDFFFNKSDLKKDVRNKLESRGWSRFFFTL